MLKRNIQTIYVDGDVTIVVRRTLFGQKVTVTRHSKPTVTKSKQTPNKPSEDR